MQSGDLSSPVFGNISCRLCLIAILLLTVLIHTTSLRNGTDWGGDFAAYIHQAKSLAEGSKEEFEDWAAFRVQKSSADITVGPPLYPWGFPAFLSPIYDIFGLNPTPMKLLILAFVVATQALLFFLLRGRVSDQWVLLIVLMMGLNPDLFFSKNVIVSDIPSAFFVLLSLYLMQRVIVDKHPLHSPVVDHVFIGLAIFLAFFMRTHALVLIPTLIGVQVACLLLNQMPITLRSVPAAISNVRIVMLVPFLVVVLGLTYESQAFPGSILPYFQDGRLVVTPTNETVTFLQPWMARAGRIAYYIQLPREFLNIPFVGHYLNVFLIFPLACLGALRKWRRDYVLLIFVLLYMAVLIVFPGVQGLRYVAPVIPLYFYFAIVGGIELDRFVVAKYQFPIRVPSPAKLIFVSLAMYLALNVSARWIRLNVQDDWQQHGPYVETSQQLFAFVRGETQSDSVFVFWKPRVFMLFGERRTITTVDPVELLDGRAQFVVVLFGNDKTNRRSGVAKYRNDPLMKVVAQNRDRFGLAYCNDDFLLFQIKGESSEQEQLEVIDQSSCVP